MNPIQHMDRVHSQLFLIRPLAEAGNDRSDSERREGSGDQIKWCGKLQYGLSGEAQYFRGWPTLIELLLEMTGNHRIDANAQGVSSTEVLQ